ncbi:hypothetical protein LCGC14_2235690, partial [marine sediment metagenome]
MAVRETQPAVMETFQILCSLSGIALGVFRDHGDGFPVQNTRRNRHCTARTIQSTPGSVQSVWCPTTALGTWVMKWRGNVMITGNTRATSKALAQALRWIPVLAGYSGTPFEEM